MEDEASWACRHFSLSNPEGKTAGDLPRLLRRLATAMERQGVTAMDVLDVTIGHEMTADGPWWSATVYWSPDGRDDGHDGGRHDDE